MTKNKKQKNIPKGWQEKKLGEICEINPKVLELPEEFIYIDLESVVSGKLIKKNKILKCKAPSRAQRILKDNDILFQMVRPYQKNNLFFKFGDGYVASTGYAQIRAKYSPMYLYQYLNMQELVNKVLVRCTGSNYPAINSTDLSKIRILFPPLPEQKQIVKILETWDKYLDKLSRKIEIKKNIKKGIASQIMNCELSIINGREVYAPKVRLSGFSGEWESVKLGNVCEYKNGGSFEKFVTKNGKYFLITLNSIDIDGKIKNEHKRVDRADWYLQKDDLIMVLSDIAHGYFLGLVDKIPVDNKYVLNQRMGMLRKKVDFIDVEFIRRFLNINRKYFKMHGQGSSQQNLSKGDILKFKIKLPILEEQTAIAKILTTADKEIEVLEKKKKIIGEQKKYLLNNLVTGKIRIPSFC